MERRLPQSTSGSLPASRRAARHHRRRTDGFKFVELCHPQPVELEGLFTQMGFTAVARYRSKQVTLQLAYLPKLRYMAGSEGLVDLNITSWNRFVQWLRLLGALGGVG